MNAPQQRSRNLGRASRIFRVLFWVHQVLFGLPSLAIGSDLINIEVSSPGTVLTTTQGYHFLIPLLLA
jgi:hypothetical protein